MIIHTSFTPSDIELWDDDFFDMAVVIDILRATTTLLFAANSGASKIIPVGTVESALRLAKEMNNEIPLLCGERNGEKVPGFHRGNSPSEYTPDTILGRILIYTSTNGSVVMESVQRVAKNTVLASMRNISAVTKFIREFNPDKLLLACAGREGRFSLEDTYAAGMIFEKLSKDGSVVPADDGTRVASMILQRFGNDVGAVFENSIHGQYLSRELGLLEDLAAASEIDADDIVLELKNSEVFIAR